MNKYIIPIFLSVVFMTIAGATIGDYGINWDEPHRLLRGQAYLTYFLTGKTSYGLPDRTAPELIKPGEYITRYDFLAAEKDKPAILPARPQPQTEFWEMLAQIGHRLSFYQHDAWNGVYFLRYDRSEIGHLPLPELLAALSNRLFYQWWGIAGDIESYHIPYILISALGIFIVAAFVWDITGSVLASAVAGLTLMLYPLYFAEAHFNLKDPLEATFFAGSLWAFWRWVKDNRLRWLAGFIVFLTLSLAVKWNSLFLPFILAPWLWTIRGTPQFRHWFGVKRLLIYGTMGAFVMLAFLILIWPTSWGNPLQALADVARFYWQLGADGVHFQPGGFVWWGFNFYPLILFFSQTPEIVLVLAGIATVGVIKGRCATSVGVGHLLLSWIVVALFRYMVPGARSYSGIRQIMEVVPALAILAGVGADWLLLKVGLSMQKVIKIIIAISFIVLISTLIRLHPNENAYFNVLVGGLSGAYQKNLVDYFLTNGNVYRQGANWLNKQAEKDANVAILDGRMVALSPVWLRPDLSLSPYHFSGFARKGEYILFTNTQIERPVFSYQYLRRFLIPVHEMTIDGVPILSIYKNDVAHVKSDYTQEEFTTPTSVQRAQSPTGPIISIDLGADRLVTRITVAAPSGCQSTTASSFIDELVRFLPAHPDVSFDAREHSFSLLEKLPRSDGQVDYVFPAEPAKRIDIFVKSDLSCFDRGKISGVWVLSR